MTEPNKPNLRHEFAALYPKGFLNLIATVIFMILALAMLGPAISDVLISSDDSTAQNAFQIACVIVFTFLIVTPTFLLSRGSGGSKTFLRWLNLAVIVALLLSFGWEVSQQRAQAYASLVGLLFALITFYLYRSEGFLSACAFYERIWAEHRARQRDIAEAIARIRK